MEGTTNHIALTSSVPILFCHYFNTVFTLFLIHLLWTLYLGVLAVVRSHPMEPKPYTGMVPIVSGEVAEDLANYLVSVGKAQWDKWSQMWQMCA